MHYAKTLPEPKAITVPELRDDTSELLSNIEDILDQVRILL
jgi:hypothetical protein